MGRIYQIAKLVSKVEANMSTISKLKLAKRRIAQATGVKDATRDMSKESSKQKEDTDFKSRQKEIDEQSDTLK